MEIAINDIAFRVPFYTKNDAIDSIRKFLRICKYVESQKCTKVTGLVIEDIDKSFEIAPGCKLFSLIQQFQTREERSYLLSLLTNRGKMRHVEGEAFVSRGMSSMLCAWALDKAVISLESCAEFKKDYINGTIGEVSVQLKNIADGEHLRIHSELLGIRIYQANNKKHKVDRENYYGKGKVASIMDLSDEEAQNLLDKAIFVDGKLYGQKSDSYYAFQCTKDNIYHGYKVNNLSEKIVRELNHFRWD